MPDQIIDDNGISGFVDDNGASGFVDDLGNYMLEATSPVTLGDQVLDNGLAALTDADTFCLCSGEPTTYTEATSTMMLTAQVISGGVFGAITSESPVGRSVSTKPMVKLPIETAGTARYWAAVDSNTQTLLVHGPLDDEHPVYTNSLINLPAIPIAIA